MTYSIREFRADDAEALDSLCRAAIDRVGAHAYAPEQVAAWVARHPGPEMYLRRHANGHVIFVAADAADTPVAYALIEPDGHVDRLYNHPEHTRRGIAARLLARVEDYATASGMDRLYTEASELARPAFERAGYDVVSRRNFTIEHDGKAVPIHNYAMQKRIR